MPESSQPPPQPLDYANPRDLPDGPVRWYLWIPIAVCLFLLCIGLSISFVFPILDGPGSVYAQQSDESAAHLRAIGQAITMYTTDHQGAYPDSFQTVLLNEAVTSDIFILPRSTDTPATGPTTQTVADQLTAGGHLSYVYLGSGLTVNTATAKTIVAYQISPIPGFGTNVLFGDGHVEAVDAATIAKIIARAASGQFPVTMPSP